MTGQRRPFHSVAIRRFAAKWPASLVRRTEVPEMRCKLAATDSHLAPATPDRFIFCPTEIGNLPDEKIMTTHADPFGLRNLPRSAWRHTPTHEQIADLEDAITEVFVCYVCGPNWIAACGRLQPILRHYGADVAQIVLAAFRTGRFVAPGKCCWVQLAHTSEVCQYLAKWAKWTSCSEPSTFAFDLQPAQDEDV